MRSLLAAEALQAGLGVTSHGTVRGGRDLTDHLVPTPRDPPSGRTEVLEGLILHQQGEIPPRSSFTQFWDAKGAVGALGSPCW